MITTKITITPYLAEYIIGRRSTYSGQFGLVPYHLGVHVSQAG